MVEGSAVKLGPGTVRVGRFIGRLGVVAMPAIAVGWGIAGRVVRRHVARLEAIGWLSRTAGMRGEGSLVWLTADGLAGVGLGELGPLRAPTAFSAQTLHRVRVAWVAAELERHGLEWLGACELALDRQRWAITVANERGGHSPRLPDLAAWPVDDRLPVAVVLEHHQNPRRQRAGLEGWQAAITAGQYTAVRYQTGPVTARQLQRVAAQIGLTAPTFLAAEQITATELVAHPAVENKPGGVGDRAERPAAAIRAPAPPRPAVDDRPATPSMPQEPADTPEQAAERQRLIHEVLGISEPPPRRRWRRQ